MRITLENIQSRFFTLNDSRKDTFVIKLLPEWWSRHYEYSWAGEFAQKDDIVLDAGCGLEHPFKFFLLDECDEVYACDWDERILSPSSILNAIQNTFGESVAKNLDHRYLTDIHYDKASLTSLPYGDKTFDKIYCISVLEHLKDRCNKYPVLYEVTFLKNLLRNDIFLSLKEFKRVLKDDGMLVVTFDYPDINLSYLKKLIRDLGLTLAGKWSVNIPENVLYNETLRLYCFRAIIQKKKY